MIARVRRDYGLTLLLTEHDMEVIFGLATRLTVLHYGEIIASGAPEEVRADARVREVYLGHA
jgi:branched-chain amino acid transport system ATP-binding protein